jgi:hypothetical protein
MKLKNITIRILFFLSVWLLAAAITTGTAPSAEANTAIDFGTGAAYVTFGDAAGLHLPQFTIECWFKREGTGTTAGSGSGGVTAIPLVTKGRGEDDGSNIDMNYFLGIRSSDNVLAADFEDAATGLNHPVVGVTPVVNGVWYHAAATYNGTKWQLFLNGSLEAELTANATPRADSIQHAGLGTAMNSSGTPEGHFDGVLDEVRIWNYARSLAQIKSTINSEMTTAQTGLVTRWGLDEGTGTAVNGSAGTAVNGTLVGTGSAWVAGSPFDINLPPDPPGLNAPANGAAGVSTSPLLGVTVTDPEDDSLTVKFYGRLKPPAGESFTIIALPDTQYYSAETNGGTREIFNAQTQWIVDNRAARNIAFVAHMGDIVDVAATVSQWQNADAALSRLEDASSTGLADGLPYGLAVGNHDQNPNGNPDDTANFNSYFGANRFSGRAYYGGHYGSDNDNHFVLYNAGGMDFIVIFLEYDTATSTETPARLWADGLLKTYSGRRAIVVSHYLIDSSGNFSSQGQAIFNALKDNPNLFLMLCGHVSEANRQDTGDNGNVIYTLMADYQTRANGGSGWLRIFEFVPAANEIRVKTYSPTLDQYETDANSQITLSYNMVPSVFAELGTETGVASGEQSTFAWAGLLPSTEYDWYATVSDGAKTTTGPIWSFRTIGVAGDINGDCDVDGSDLAALIVDPNLVDLYAFALSFGADQCP